VSLCHGTSDRQPATEGSVGLPPGGLGSITRISDASGNAANTFAYDLWGMTSREADAGSRIHRCRARNLVKPVPPSGVGRMRALPPINVSPIQVAVPLPSGPRAVVCPTTSLGAEI